MMTVILSLPELRVVKFFLQIFVQRSKRRVIFEWAIKHVSNCGRRPEAAPAGGTPSPVTLAPEVKVLPVFRYVRVSLVRMYLPYHIAMSASRLILFIIRTRICFDNFSDEFKKSRQYLALLKIYSIEFGAFLGERIQIYLVLKLFFFFPKIIPKLFCSFANIF